MMPPGAVEQSGSGLAPRAWANSRISGLSSTRALSPVVLEDDDFEMWGDTAIRERPARGPGTR